MREDNKKMARKPILLLAALAMIAAACGGGETTTPETVVVTSIVTETSTVTEIVPGQTITFWSTETQPERLKITKGIIDRFTAETGVGVVLVPVDEGGLSSIMTSAAATGILPEVIFHPIDFTIGWYNEGLLDSDAASDVIATLGEETFAQGAIDLARVDGQPVAVPSDGWGQLLLYRKDLFDAAGLAAPTTFDAIETAAAALHDPANNFYGITAATDGGAVFTQQTFEHFALANGCQLTDSSGNVTVGSSNCSEAVGFYTDLMANYSPGGVQTVVSTRATYFAGQAAMIVWSPFILDEMAGLRDAAFPACAECAADPAYLAKNTGIIPAFSGPSGEPAQYGQVSYMGIGTGSKTDLAKMFLEFWFTEGYLDWLSTSVEGKFPMRRGTADNPTAFVDGWKALETGVDRKAALSEFYSTEVIDLLIAGSASFDRWGFAQGQGQLVSAVYGSLPVPQAIASILEGTMTLDEAMAEILARVQEEKDLLG